MKMIKLLRRTMGHCISMSKLQVLVSLLLVALFLPSHAAEQVTYYHNDALGSPVATTDETGNLLWKEAYRPYGDRIRKEDGGTNKTWYTGKQHDDDIGLSYFNARWYDPTIGRFMGIDPASIDPENIHRFYW